MKDRNRGVELAVKPLGLQPEFIVFADQRIEEVSGSITIRLRLEDFGVAEIQTRGFGEIPCDAAVRRQVGCGLFGSCCTVGIRLAIPNLPVCVPARLEFGITGAGNNVSLVRQVVAGAEQQTQIGSIRVVACTILEN